MPLAVAAAITRFFAIIFILLTYAAVITPYRLLAQATRFTLLMSGALLFTLLLALLLHICHVDSHLEIRRYAYCLPPLLRHIFCSAARHALDTPPLFSTICLPRVVFIFMPLRRLQIIIYMPLLLFFAAYVTPRCCLFAACADMLLLLFR